MAKRCTSNAESAMFWLQIGDKSAVPGLISAAKTPLNEKDRNANVQHTGSIYALGNGSDDEYLNTWGMFVLYKPFEYKFDDQNNFKLRYNSGNYDLEIKRYAKLLVFDPKTDSFIQDNQFVVRTHHYFKGSYSFGGNVYEFSSSLGSYEYDSRTKECKFIHDNAWDNFKEKHKWAIYTGAFTLTLIVCALMIWVCRRIHKNRMKVLQT